MNRKAKRDPRRRHPAEPTRPDGFTDLERRFLMHLATEFEREHGRWPEVGDVLMLDDDGAPVRRGPGPFPARP